MIIPLPTLSLSGWVTNTVEKADFLLSHFFESDKAQSYIYSGNVANLQWLIEKYGHNVDELCLKIENDLETYLKNYYPAVVIDIVPIVNKEKPSEITLRLFCKAAEEGKEVNFGKLIHVSNAKISKIINLNNNGEEIS